MWYSANRGGRPGSDPLSAVDWVNLNGTVDPSTAAVTARTDLQITQFTSIANVPTLPARFWGGTQDNGTPRKSTLSASWFDIPSGDGGQARVDPTSDPYVYGTYMTSRHTALPWGLSFLATSLSLTGLSSRPRRVLRSVCDEPHQPRSTVPRHFPTLPH